MLEKRNWHQAMDKAMNILDNNPDASQAMFAEGIAQGFVGA